MADVQEPPDRVTSRIGLPIAEDKYKADQATLEHFQSFSTELLRLSLLGIGAIGFLLKDVAFTQEGTKNAFDQKLIANAWSVVAALVGLTVSAAFALAHRYLSSDAFAYVIWFIRLNDPKSPATYDRNTALRAREQLAIHMRFSWWALLFSAVALGIGATFLVVSFSLILVA